MSSAHRTKHLSSQSDHWTKGSLHWVLLFTGPIHRGEVRVEDEQFLPGVVAGLVLKPVPGPNTQPPIPKASAPTSTPRLH